MAGYSKTPLVKKLGIKENFSIFLSNAPDNYFDLLSYLPENTEVTDKPPAEPIDFVHWFVRNREELERNFLEYKAMIKKNGMLWVSWPKGSSPLKSDFNETNVRITGLSSGLVDNKVCAVDEDWSALRFVYRIKDR